MAWAFDNWFPSWGSTGQQPPTDKNYAGGEQIAFEHLNYLWFSLNRLEDEVQSALDDIDSNANGIADEADSTNLYKDNELDSNGDGVVDEAENALLLEGSQITDSHFWIEDSVNLSSGDEKIIYIDRQPSSVTITAHKATLVNADGTPTPSGVTVRFASVTGGSPDVSGTEIVTSDGTEIVDAEPTATYSPSNTEPVAVLVENGTTSQQHVYVSITAQQT